MDREERASVFKEAKALRGLYSQGVRAFQMNLLPSSPGYRECEGVYQPTWRHISLHYDVVFIVWRENFRFHSKNIASCAVCANNA